LFKGQYLFHLQLEHRSSFVPAGPGLSLVKWQWTDHYGTDGHGRGAQN
jgi:hypothetical protein